MNKFISAVTRIGSYKLKFILLSISAIIFIACLSCNNASPDDQGNNNGSLIKNSTQVPDTITPNNYANDTANLELDILFATEAEFKDLYRKKEGNAKIGFQFCVLSTPTQQTLTLGAWPGKENGKFIGDAPTLLLHRWKKSAYDLKNQNIYLSSLKLIKRSAENILAELNREPKDQVVIFDPSYRATNFQVSYEVYVVDASLMKDNTIKLVKPTATYRLNPSPPASSANNSEL